MTTKKKLRRRIAELNKLVVDYASLYRSAIIENQKSRKQLYNVIKHYKTENEQLTEKVNALMQAEADLNDALEKEMSKNGMLTAALELALFIISIHVTSTKAVK